MPKRIPATVRRNVTTSTTITLSGDDVRALLRNTYAKALGVRPRDLSGIDVEFEPDGGVTLFHTVEEDEEFES